MSSEDNVPVARTFRPRDFLFVAALAALLSASCVESGPAGPTATLIPSDAIAAVVVESPYKLYAAAEQFWKAAKLDAEVGSDLQGLLEKSVPDSRRTLEALDFARPWALAILPASGPAGGDKKTRELLYIPFRAAPEEIVGKLAGSMKVVAKAKGYIVLSDAEGQISFPPAKGADLSRLTRYSASSIKLWGDPAAIRRATSDGYKPIAEAVRRFVTEPPASGAPGPAATAQAMGELGLSLLAQLGLADASIEPLSSGLTLRGGSAAAKGSDLQKALAAASFGPPALDWASQVDSESMYGLAWSMDPALSSGLYQGMAGSLFAGLGLPGELAAKASAIQAKWSKAGGPRGAMSLDVDVDAAALSGVLGLESEGSAAIADFIKKAVRIKFDMLQDIKNEAAYRALLQGMASDPDYLAFTKAYADAFGLSFSMKSQEKKEGAFSYGELGIKLKVVDGDKLDALGGSSSSSKALPEEVLAAFESLVGARWTISNGRFVSTSGDLAALKALAARKSAPKSLAADSAFAAFAKTMPPKTLCVGVFSMKKLMSLAGSLVAATGRDTGKFDPESFSSWYSYIAVDARGLAPGLEAGLLIPASDIGAVAQASGAFKKPTPPADGEAL